MGNADPNTVLYLVLPIISLKLMRWKSRPLRMGKIAFSFVSALCQHADSL